MLPPLPTDRPIDGVDQTDVFFGNSATGNRESLLTFIGADMVAVRWKQWRMYFTDVQTDRHRPAASTWNVLIQCADGRLSEDHALERSDQSVKSPAGAPLEPLKTAHRSTIAFSHNQDPKLPSVTPEARRKSRPGSKLRARVRSGPLTCNEA